jgi:hypothetical protein
MSDCYYEACSNPECTIPECVQARARAASTTTDGYKICVYVAHGYFEYEVSRPEQAVEHAQQIMERGVYRRPLPDGSGLEMFHAYKVKVLGPDMASAYTDTFKRT